MKRDQAARVRKFAVTIAIMFSLQSAVSWADGESKPWSVNAATAVFSDYMFRGFNLYDGTSIQPSVGAKYDTGMGTVGGSLWMHLSGEGDRQEEKFTELDETLTYSVAFGPATVQVGNVWYTYPDDTDAIKDSAEVFGVLSVDDSEFNSVFTLTPTLSVYHDYREYDAQYYELGISHPLTPKWLGEGFNVTPFAAFGFASNAEKVYNDNGLVQITWGLSSTVPLGIFSLTPSVNYTHKIDDATVNELWFGTTLAVSF